MSQDQFSYGESTVNSCRLGDGASGDLQGRANSVSQVERVSDMAPACHLCDSVGGGFRKGIMASAYLSVWEKVVPHVSP